MPLGITVNQAIHQLSEEALENCGAQREQILRNFTDFMEKMEDLKTKTVRRIDSLTIISGYNKNGVVEDYSLTMRPGEIICIVGPTGSGKSRLLADIECLAQADTPTGRRILIDGKEPDASQRFALEHKLAIASHDNRMADKTSMAAFGQDMIKNSAVTFIWVADIKRMAWRYGERGYRYIFLDAGHVCQNLYLAAEAIGCGVCAVAAFDDDLLNETLGIDGKNHFAVYLATVGKKVVYNGD